MGTERKRFPKVFWVANAMELFERNAFYGIWLVLGIYLTTAPEEGGLGFTATQKGDIQGWATWLMYILPIVTGAIGDIFGYKKMLFGAFCVLGLAYGVLGFVDSYTWVFFWFMVVAVGAAMFKPMISGTVGRVTDADTSDRGFSIMYMVVNIGGFVGPIIAGVLREWSWTYVFIASTISIVVVNMGLLFFYEEPIKTEERKSWRDLIIVARNAVIVFKNIKFMIILCIFLGFWMMFWQLMINVPNFIKDWVDTTTLLVLLPDWMHSWVTVEKTGQVNPEYLVNMNAMFVIFFVTWISGRVRKLKALPCIVIGITVAALGMITFGFALGTAWFLFLAIATFSFGEMIANPKFLSYAARIAPKDQVAVYQGYAFLPVAFGGLLSGVLGGRLYDAYATPGVEGANPWVLWLIFGGIGLLSAAVLLVFHVLVPPIEQRKD